MQIRHLSAVVCAFSMAVAGSAFAKGHAAPNCTVNGKQVHYHSKKTCEKKHGTWMADAAGTTSTSTTTNATTPASSTSTTTTK